MLNPQQDLLLLYPCILNNHILPRLNAESLLTAPSITPCPSSRRSIGKVWLILVPSTDSGLLFFSAASAESACEPRPFRLPSSFLTGIDSCTPGPPAGDSCKGTGSKPSHHNLGKKSNQTVPENAAFPQANQKHPAP
jgi:hypothetical protein